MTRYQIAVDAMGGDHAPTSVVDGVKLALAEMNDIEIRLCGPASALDACRDDRVHPVEANQVITMEEAPMLAVRKKTDSSLVKAMLEVREGRAQAVVSAGSTGAVLAVLGVLIAISRVVTGVHYISDVLAGLAFGGVFAVLGWNAFVLAASALGFYAIMLL